MILKRNNAALVFGTVLGAVLAVAAFCGISLGAQTTEQLLQQAQEALEKKEYAEAAKALETYLA